jgi:hypothetical protein
MCAGAKSSAGLFRMSNEPALDPGSFGVKFNFKTMHCDHTSGYCGRLGMDYNENSKECKYKPGQKGAEYLFGETLVRGSIRSWDNASDFAGMITQSNGVHNEVIGGVLLATFVATNPVLGLALIFLGPAIQDLINTVSRTFKDKPIPEQIENNVIAERQNKNIEIRDKWSFIYDLDRNKFLVSGPINFGV